MADTPGIHWRAALRHRRRFLLALSVAGAGLAVAVALALPPSYVATARILVEAPQVPAGLARPAATDSMTGRIGRLEQRLASREGLLALARRHGLYPDSGSTETVGRMRDALEIRRVAAGTGAAGAELAAITVSFEARGAARAAAVANDLVERLLADARALGAERAGDATAVFTAELDRLGRSLAEAEGAIAAFKRAEGEALPEHLAARRAEAADLARRIAARRVERLEIATEHARLTDAAAERARSLDPARAEALRPGARRLTREIARLGRALALVDVAAEADRARLAALRASIAATPGIERRLLDLVRVRDALKARHALAAAKQAEAALAERIETARQAERFELVEAAAVPDEPEGPRRGLVAAGGALASILAALGTALLLESGNRRIRDGADLQRLLGIDAIVSVPAMPRARHPLRRRTLAALLLLGLGTAALAGLGDRPLDQLLPTAAGAGPGQ